MIERDCGAAGKPDYAAAFSFHQLAPAMDDRLFRVCYTPAV